MDSTGIFSGRSAWFSSSCPRTHVDSWVNNGGSRFSSAETEGKARGGVDFVFLKDLEDPVYARLSGSTSILLSSLWVQVSAEQNKQIPLGLFLLDRNHSSATLNLTTTNTNASAQPFKTPLIPTQSYPPQPGVLQISSSVSSAPHSDSAHSKRKRPSQNTSNALEPLRFKKPMVVVADIAEQSASSLPPPYLLPHITQPTTTPFLLLPHIAHLLPPASSIPNRGSYRFGTGGKEEYRGGLGVGVFDVEGGREDGRFEAVLKKRVKLEPED